MKGFAKFSWLLMILILVLNLFQPAGGIIFAGAAGVFIFIFLCFEINLKARVRDYQCPRQLAGTGKWADTKRSVYERQVKAIPQTVKAAGWGTRMVAVMWLVMQIGFGGLMTLAKSLALITGDNMASLAVIDIPGEKQLVVGIVLYILAAVCCVCMAVAVWKRASCYREQVTGGAAYECN